MTKQDIVNLIDYKIRTENNNYKKHMENNLNDKQREHDHAVIMSIYVEILDDLNLL